jgi:hypothetical protein
MQHQQQIDFKLRTWSSLRAGGPAGRNLGLDSSLLLLIADNTHSADREYGCIGTDKNPCYR